MMMNHKFDERQLQKRGNAFKIGFFTLLIENALYLFLCVFLYDDPTQLRGLPITPAACLILQICIAIAIFASYCIWNDCYFSLYDNRKQLISLFTVCTALNLLCAIAHLIDGDFLEDGVLGTPFINLVCGVLTLFILLMILLKRFRGGESDE